MEGLGHFGGHRSSIHFILSASHNNNNWTGLVSTFLVSIFICIALTICRTPIGNAQHNSLSEIMMLCAIICVAVSVRCYLMS